MTDLYVAIFERWVKALDEIDTIAMHKEKVVSTRYASSFRYDLRDYDRPDFPAGGALSDQQPDDRSDYHIFGMNKDGLPEYVSFAHRHNKVDWEGFYNYSDSAVEYIEFNLITGTPSCIKVVNYENGRRSTFGHFQINGRGSMIWVKNDEKEVAIQKLFDSPDAIICNVEKYVYDGEKIVKAECLSVSPGIGLFEYEKIYTYTEEGELDQIKSFFANGNTGLNYVRIDKGLPIETLMGKIAERMAAAIIKALLEKKVEEPLSLLELSYQYPEGWVPFLRAWPLSRKEEILANVENTEIFEELFLAPSNYSDMIYIDSSSFERPLQQLVQIMDEAHDFELGRKMLYKTASLLTLHKLDQKIAVSDDFVAYPADWEITGNRFPEILLECGQTPEIIKLWKTKGWLGWKPL